MERIRLKTSLFNLKHSLQLLTGMGAKLACSAHFISGFDPQHIRCDLQAYSRAFHLLSFKYSSDSVQAELCGAGKRTAQFVPKAGSTLLPSGCEPRLNLPSLLQPGDINSRNSRVTETAIDGKTQKLSDEILKEDIENGFDTRALLVVRDGKLISESYGPGISNDTRLLGWSMTKSLTAILFGRMEQLGLADPQSDQLFPEWQHDQRREITLEHLLQMRSGLRFDERYLPGSDVTRMLFTDPNCWQRALDSPLIHPPGAFFDYASGSTNLLTRWMQLRLGGTQACMDFLYRELLWPLGMSNTLFEMDASGVLVGSSYTYATGRDWAQLAALLLNRGRHSGQQIVSEDWVARALRPNASDNDDRYGYQIWLNSGDRQSQRYTDLPQDACFMLGNHEQKIMMAPSLNTAIVRLGWCAAEYPIEERFRRFL
ncbi:serine hydrolase domain-containing protein [Microbulbifer celer]|uniref:Serine hydrolase domain-containing protein n=1 Tax=Microbulbifer celer TaxID=435905 RepID=A0ABW3UBU5_9GAMM|nr:serine hydrolase [Microbulbifer celer]UFN58859.1 beta-lactamase family protein [Microbulbifer celer]